MYYHLSEDELKAICRRSIESLEIWARRLIHEKMTEKYGENYVNTQKEDGSYLINKETRTHIERMLVKEPERAKRLLCFGCRITA